MKNLIITAICLTIFAFSPIKTGQNQQPKTYKVTLSRTIQEWQSTIQAIGNSPNLSAQYANTLTSEIANQVQQQIAEETKKDSSVRPNKPK